MTVEGFWARVEKTENCWIWRGAPNGPYSEVYLGVDKNGRRVRTSAHRYSYELAHGKIPAGLQIDHLCRNTRCVNPDHLEAVTIGENVLRGIGVTARNARATHCKRGHEFTPQNTGLQRVRGVVRGRFCRICHQAAWRAWHKKTEATAA